MPKEGTRIDGDVRYLRPDETGAEGEREFHALFTVAELLAQRRHDLRRVRQPAPASRRRCKEQCLKLGVRGYLGPGYDSGRWVGDEHGPAEARA